LFSDLLKLARQSDDAEHFMATIVCYRTPETKAVGTTQYRIYDIVDGQQRLTTLILLLKCIELCMPLDSEDRIELARILVKRDGHLILLQTNNTNERIFNNFIREGIYPTKQDLITHSDFNLSDAIKDCQSFTEKWKETRSVADLMRIILHRLGFVVHDTEDARAVYTVFEVLNSRGLDVDWLDQAKSLLMGQAYELSDSTEAANAEIISLQGIWGQLYQEIAKEDIPGHEILRITTTLYYGAGAGKPRSADDSLRLLRENADTFSKPRQISELLLNVARKLTSLQTEYPISPVTDILHARLLAVAIMIARGVNDKERESLLDQWERVTFRIFGLCGKDSRTKVGDYVRLAARIVKEDQNTRTFNQIMSQIKELGAEYPIEKAIDEGLIARDCYEYSTEFCRYLLWLFEEYLAKKEGSGATVDDKAWIDIRKKRATDTIEHIFPQSYEGAPAWQGKMLDEQGNEEKPELYIGRIGNLLLVPKRLNEEASRKPFKEKKDIYCRHNLRSVRKVCEEEDWNLEKIKTRENEIAEWAKQRWNDI
jgi:hypothetical protein